MLFFSLLIFLSPPAWGTTLIEATTAVGIANTLQNTQQGAVQGQLDRANQTVQEYQSAIDRGQAQHEEITGSPQIFIHDRHDPNSPARPWDSANPDNQGVEISKEQLHDILQIQQAEERHQQILSEEARRRHIEHITEEFPTEFNPDSKDISSKKTTVNYKAKTVVFYKKDCAKTETQCRKSHPVLTNIKSVIFNHAQGRLISVATEK